MKTNPALKIRVKIGETEKTYVLVKTNAPLEYDSFGSFTIKDYLDLEKSVKHSWREGPHRYTLIPVEHLPYHEGRYASGLYSSEVQEENANIRNWVEEMLWERISRISGTED